MALAATFARRLLAARIALACGTYALLGGVITLVGWSSDLPRLTDWFDNGISQLPNSGLAVAVSAAALILLALEKRRLAAILGVLVALIGVATLFEHITGVDLNIDRLLFPRDWGQRGTVAPGRMGVPGSTALSIIGISLVLAAFERARRYAVSGGLLTTIVVMPSLIGYFLVADTLYAIPTLTTIAPQTATMIVALGVGLVATITDRLPMKLLVENSAAALMVGRALPGIVLLPLVLGWISVRGQQARLFDIAFGAAVLVSSLIAFLALLIFWSAVAVRAHEAAEHDSRERLARTLDSITDAFLTIDSDWRYTFVNRQAEAQFGKSRAELLGANMWELFPMAVGRLAYRQLHRAMQERAAVEYQFLFTPRQRWFAERAYPTPEGGLAIYSRDITDSRRAEELLRQSEERLQLAIGIANAGMFDLDLINGINHWSESHFTLLGLQPTADRIAPGSGWSDIVVAEDWPAVQSEWRRAELAHDTFRSEHRLRWADGNRFVWVKAAGKFDYDADGKAVRFVGIFFDISEHMRNEEELHRLGNILREADRRKDEFLATLAHELRNPLAPMRNSIELLKHPETSDGARNQALATLERQLHHMIRLVDDLLDVGRISRDKLEIRLERIDLATAIQNAVDACRPALDDASQELVVALPATACMLDADPVRLTQVFVNLLGNACKYTERGGRISLTAEQGNGVITVSVRDTGVGIQPQMLPKVFDIFTQVDRSLERSRGGLGIGLSLVKRLVTLHGGEIRAHSDGIGRGSLFVVTLPVLNSSAVSEQKSPPAIQSDAAQSRRILVVDDNHDAAATLAMLLQLNGDVVETAADGINAVEKAASFGPDVVLLDIGLPKLNGYDTCRAIRAQSNGRHILIVALTGWGQDDDRRRSDEAGFDAHLVKPVDQSVLMALLNDAHKRAT